MSENNERDVLSFGINHPNRESLREALRTYYDEVGKLCNEDDAIRRTHTANLMLHLTYLKDILDQITDQLKEPITKGHYSDDQSIVDFVYALRENIIGGSWVSSLDNTMRDIDRFGDDE